MATAEQLKQAQYIYRGDGGPMPDGHCCGLPLPCDHVRVVESENEPNYYFCDLLQMRVADYDSCKYYSDGDFVGSMMDFVDSKQKIKDMSKSQKQKSIWKRLFGNK